MLPLSLVWSIYVIASDAWNNFGQFQRIFDVCSLYICMIQTMCIVSLFWSWSRSQFLKIRDGNASCPSHVL